MPADAPKFEAVYYPSPIPSSGGALTLMALVFDRIHFPNVYIPQSGFDPGEVNKEIDRIAAHGFKDYDSRLLLGVLHYSTIAKTLSDVCYFTGEKGQVFGGKLDDANQLANALGEQIYGKPAPGFTPIVTPGSHKGLPGSDEYIDYPGILHYPTNALVYAARNQIPLINDNPHFPVLALGGETAKNNAKLLASVVAMECVSIALPKIRVLTPDEIIEFRAENSAHLAGFRTAMLAYAWELSTNFHKYGYV